MFTLYHLLSHDEVPGSDITPFNKIDKPLVVDRLVTLRNYYDIHNNVAFIWQNLSVFQAKTRFKRS